MPPPASKFGIIRPLINTVVFRTTRSHPILLVLPLHYPSSSSSSGLARSANGRSTRYGHWPRTHRVVCDDGRELRAFLPFALAVIFQSLFLSLPPLRLSKRNNARDGSMHNASDKLTLRNTQHCPSETSLRLDYTTRVYYLLYNCHF